MSLLNMPTTAGLSAYQEKVILEGVTYLFRFTWNTRNARWNMDIIDSSGNLVLGSIPVEVQWDLTGRYIKRISGLPPGMFMAWDTTGHEQPPDFNSIGQDVPLLYLESA
jgi:hypothetical protein